MRKDREENKMRVRREVRSNWEQNEKNMVRKKKKMRREWKQNERRMRRKCEENENRMNIEWDENDYREKMREKRINKKWEDNERRIYEELWDWWITVARSNGISEWKRSTEGDHRNNEEKRQE